MNEWNEYIEDEFPKVERIEVSFDDKDSLKRYAISDEEIQSHFQKEISGVQLNESRKKRLKKEENNRSVYFWISAMAAGWAIALVLRTFIVIPDKLAPVEYTYQRPEKKLEKKIDQRDTIYLISSDWLIPWNEFNLEYYCGGSNYPDMWNPAYGYGLPNGTMPWSSLVYIPPVDSAQSIPIPVNQDSVLVAKIDSNLQQLKSNAKAVEYLTIREFVAQEIDERVQKIRKVKQFFRASRLRNREDHEDRMVIEWKGKRIGL
jgi:hypothetical protein